MSAASHIRGRLSLLLPAAALLLAPMHLSAVDFGSSFSDYTSIESVSVGGTLPNLSASDWWYGCAPTSAGMMMAYYDTNGYNGYSYGNLIPGGTAGYSNVGAWPNGQLLRSTIASEGHQRDYYNAATYGYNNGGDSGFGYLEEHDDLASLTHTYDCLADFMGTSQDAFGGPNGSSSTCYYSNGSRLYISEMINEGFAVNTAVGIAAYVNFAGYSVANCYTHYSDLHMKARTGGGFTFDDYAAEIAAGRPVLLAYSDPDIGGHMMLGVGVDEDAQLIEFLDTWDDELQNMAWDGDFYGLTLQGVISMELATVPEPATTAACLGLLVLAFVMYRRSRHKPLRECTANNLSNRIN